MFFKRKRKKRLSLWSRNFWPEFSVGAETKQGIWILALITTAIITVMSYLNQAGEIGRIIDASIAIILGESKWVLPFSLVLTAISASRSKNKNFNSANVFGLFLFLTSLSSLLYFFNLEQSGGLLGRLSAEFLFSYVGDEAAATLFSVGFITSLLIMLNTSLSQLLGKESYVFKTLVFIIKIIFYPFIRRDFDEEEDEESHYTEASRDKEEEDVKNKEGKAVVKEYSVEDDETDEEEHENQSSGLPRRPPGRAPRNDNDFWSKSNIKMNIPLALLKSKPKKPLSGNIDRNQDIIKKTLNDFGIPIALGEVKIGPSVTQYSFKPGKGIPVGRIRNLSDDLAMELALHPVRIEAPIPGKALVGLEVPNQTKVLVSLKELLRSKQFKERKSNTMLALGRDIGGKVWFHDLIKLPHLLVAGATNSGKSICLHSLITSLIYQNDPDDLKMILIDVKQVELTVYNGLPYLIAPVVTENKRAIRALRWCLDEMGRRLKILSQTGYDNIQEYNKNKKRLPYLVVVVDELGDLMSSAKKETEAAIIRLGQKARAAGIHLILAMQRPSVDILSGLIKANLPGRISFQVTSSINSKTILDFVGAEKLIGQGDMLFMNPGLNKPVRIQGTYIGKDEIKSVVRYVKKKAGKAKYVEEITEQAQNQFNFEQDGVDDDLLSEAKQMILDSNKASATMLQSRLSIGYPRANRILDILEREGMVGPSIQNKPREVYIEK